MSISAENIKFFKETIKRLQDHLQQAATKDTTDEIVKFENQLTLRELEECLSSSAEKDLEENLKKILANRWERIRHSTAAYTQQPLNEVNELCLELANTLSPLPEPAKYNELGMGEGPYFLLMPSLTVHETLSYENIHHLKLHEFILSDNGELFIPLISSLELAFASSTGIMSHQMLDPRTPKALYPPLLTSSEMLRVSEHSPEVKIYHQLIEEYNQKRFHEVNLSNKLTKLANALWRGGAHGGRGGEEFDSGVDANVAISDFSQFWDACSKEIKDAAFKEYSGLEDILGRLMRPNDARYSDVQFCVELIAGDLQPIAEKCRAAEQSIISLKERIEAQKQKIISMMKSADYPLSRAPGIKQPKVLAHIFALDEQEQKEIFKHTPSQSGLLYALEQEPLALPQYFDLLDTSAKQIMISARFERGDTALILAAQEGGQDSVALLLKAGAETDAADNNNSTALHWAAQNGHNEVVELLIENKAQINLKGAGGNTPPW